MKKTLLISTMMALASASVFGSVLWNQRDPGGFAAYPIAYIDTQYIGASPQYTSYVASDVVANQDWTVDSMSWDFAAQSTHAIGDTITGALFIYSNNGSALPGAGDNPDTDATIMNATVTAVGTDQFGNPAYTLTVDFGGDVLPAGEYWIGFAPDSNVDDGGGIWWLNMQIANYAGANYGDAWRNTGGGWGYGTDWQNINVLAGDGLNYYGAIEVDGTAQAVPEPASLAVLGLGLVGLISRRRRK